MAIAGVRYNLQLAYRSCEGLAISALGKKDAPDYTTLCRRINKMNVTSAEGCVEVRSKGSLMRLIPDGTGADTFHAQRLDTPQAQGKAGAGSG